MSQDPYFQKLFADRIGGAQFGKGNEIYKFEKIKRAKRKAISDHPNRKLIDFGIGENDEVAPLAIRQEMERQIHRPENRGYPDNGIAEFKEAVAAFMQRNLGVTLDAKTEINHCIGSKPALAMLPAAFINPGDITLMTVPGYPVAATHTRYYGGEVFKLPLLSKNNFLPDLDAIPEDVRRRAKLLVLCYPNSPTGKCATVEFYKRVIDFALRNEIVVVQDAAHLMLSYGAPPLSFLSVPGAKDVGVEVHTMSKAFHMIGWRLGWVCGNERIVHAFADIKDNCDSGQFAAIQRAAIVGLNDDSIPKAVKAKYQRRLVKLVQTLTKTGFQCTMPEGSYFLYAPAPKGTNGGVAFENAEAASQYLITEYGIVTVPWDDAGAYLRFSATYEAETEAGEDELMQLTLERLQAIGPVF